MYLMAVSFVGGGISELQEAQVISQTVIEASWYPNIDWLGLYPTVETTAAQLALLLLGCGIVFSRFSKRGRKRYRAYYSSSHISHFIYWNDL